MADPTPGDDEAAHDRRRLEADLTVVLHWLEHHHRRTAIVSARHLGGRRLGRAWCGAPSSDPAMAEQAVADGRAALRALGYILEPDPERDTGALVDADPRDPGGHHRMAAVARVERALAAAGVQPPPVPRAGDADG